jgi:hypothetical protein
VYLITIWYRHDERAVRIALVIAFCNLAGAFGGAIAYGIGHINGAAGLEGFRWLFIIEVYQTPYIRTHSLQPFTFTLISFQTQCDSESLAVLLMS